MVPLSGFDFDAYEQFRGSFGFGSVAIRTLKSATYEPLRGPLRGFTTYEFRYNEILRFKTNAESFYLNH